MSLYVLDTDTLSLVRYGHPQVTQRIAAHPPAELAITVITVEERLSGWYTVLRRATRPQQLEQAYGQLADSVRFLALWPILPFNAAAITRYDQLKTLRLNVGTMDLRIGAIVLENGGTVVTRNVRDFQRIPHLAVEDWSV
jgi:tRNA(fMet)-specific endonuclease VapC